MSPMKRRTAWNKKPERDARMQNKNRGAQIPGRMYSVKGLGKEANKEELDKIVLAYRLTQNMNNNGNILQGKNQRHYN